MLIKLDIFIKLNMSEAFDKLNWEYIEHIILAFGFSTH